MADVVMLVLCFLAGSIPFGFLVGKICGIDIRKEGSGNIGATNVFRVLGKKWGLLTFLLDMLKGFVPLVAAKYGWLAHTENVGILPVNGYLILAGGLVILGHNFCPWLGFKGGKGMASSAGVLVALMPAACMVTLGVWGSVFLLTRYVSVASIAVAVLLPAAAYFLYPDTPSLLGLSLFLGVMAVWRHRSNIQRLLKGTEHQFQLWKKS